MDRTQIADAVREVLRELLVADGGAAAAGSNAPALPAAEGAVCRPRYKPRAPALDPAELARVTAASPARLAQGRAGTRYLTQTYIRLRADHAIALDAVESTVPDGFAKQLGALELRSRCKDHTEFLLYPNQGRRLSDESRALLEKEGTKGADIQVICGDGLSAWAILENGPTLLPALQDGLKAAGFSVGRPLFVHHCRIGVQDEVGLVLGNKATVVLVGERPGLGSGDSLSIYTAFGPKLDQDNAEKDCISNVRELGIPPAEAAAECVKLLQRTFKAGGGGVHLTQSAA